ncbi:DUF2586 family protein [Chitinophaga flava]|uniref:Tail sheath protein subtilisin-like domain-containing protein n=1 Tax=Chitinophaga flava TaxID=2259036 RepID=A0A365XQC2_9BACT|nr:DUF2586 family protein [Chitinophaga flava]RBL88537.1 hypothetical protein DF182_18330 [Chitinophaga flava]
MARPKVNISTTNGNLGGLAPNVDGVCGLIMAIPQAPTSGFGTPVLIKSKKQAGEELAQATNAQALTAINDGFFAEAAEGSKLYCLFVAAATTMEDMLLPANADKLLTFANGTISLLGLAKFPASGYTPVVTDGIDADVVKAADAAQILSTKWFNLRKPFRALLQGFGFTTPSSVKSYAADKKDNIGIVLGTVNGNGPHALLLALGRASGMPVQRNIGRVKSGSLKLQESAVVKIGDKNVDAIDSVDLDTLWEKRYITFERNEAAPGYLFNDDNMLGTLTSDFSSLRNGRTIDKAVRIAYEVYYNELKNDVDVDDNGRLSSAIEAALSLNIEEAISRRMAGEISQNNDGTPAVEALVNPDPSAYAGLYSAAGIDHPDFNILATNLVYIFVRIRPKGCLKYIDVFLGYTAA